MKSVPLSIFAIVTLALLGAAGTAQAAVINLMPGALFVSKTGWNFGAVGGGATPNNNFTDVNNNTGWYAAWGGSNTANYDLGATYVPNEVGIRTLNDTGHRRNPTDVVLNFYTSNTFTTLVTTRTVSLANQPYNLVPFTEVSNARFVQFQFLGGHQYPNPSDPSDDPQAGLVTELELYHVPEPASLGFLMVGGIVSLRLRRR